MHAPVLERAATPHLHTPRPPVPSISTTIERGIPMKRSLSKQAEDDALAVLNTVWDDPRDPMLPVDPVRIARALGVRVLVADLHPDVAGGIVKEPGHDARIMLNEADSRRRMRVACAHALGHYARCRDDQDDYEFVDYRGTLAPASVDEDDEERYADVFAATLLMPERVVRRLARRARSQVELVWRFGVPREAVQHRLEQLGVAV